MTVGELCNREVIICDPEETILEAARRMRDRHVGCLVVVEGEPGERVPIGIVTDRDLVLYAAATDGRIGERPVRYVMSADLATAREHESLNDVLRRMRVRGVRRMPVVDDRGVLQGIIALDDLLELVASELDELARLLTRERLHEAQP
jgi:CBS domain-containing protein